MKMEVHFVGYSKKEDEWKRKDELITLEPGADSLSARSSKSSFNISSDSSNSSGSLSGVSENNTPTVWRPLSLYDELGNKIKAGLKSTRKESPSVRIEMSFDKLLFDGGLARVGVKKRVYFGKQRYSLVSYNDLDSLLGAGWHWRGLNEADDFCYVILDTLEFYIYHRKPLTEFFPLSYDYSSIMCDLGYCLVFTFIRGDGTASQFGTDKAIFV